MRSRFLAIVSALSLIALSLAFVGCPTQCECGQWVGSITVSAGAWQETVECGDTVYVPEGIGAVVVSADYLCEPGNCGTNYEWLVSAPVGMNGTSDTSPCVFQFEILDECVTVRISAFCGDARCADCSFTVCPEEECECGEWESVAVSWAVAQETTECGGTVYAPEGVGAVEIIASYLCEPEECEATYEWSVSAPVGTNGTSDTSPCLFQFEVPDECVTVTISAFCGDALCDTCTFTVCPPEEECQCGQWEGITVSWGTTQGTTAACGDDVDVPFDVGTVGISASYPCEPPECEPTYEWTVSGVTAVLDSGVCTNGPCEFQIEQFPYECVEVSILVFCGDNLCETCTFIICPYMQPGSPPPGRPGANP